MAKYDFLTPKAIANRMKAKGLQKLRWYCQMCEKQCRDQNGFTCHCMSESHRRQMEIFGQNPNRIIEEYSDKFENDFLDVIKRSHPFGRVAATVVYNEFIKDRHHVHMNSTHWHSLTEFVKYLGQTGKCKVEETSKGWFINYIHRDSETLLGMKNKRIKFDLSEEEKQDKEIEKQIERAMHLMKQPSTIIASNQPSHAYELAKVDPDVNTMIRLSLGSCPKREGLPKAVFDLVEDVRKEEIRNPLKREESSGGGKSTTTALDDWLHKGIIVKVMSKSLADKGKYYKQKGVVLKMTDRYVGEIEMLETKHFLRVDQAELETVTPQTGGLVKIVNGAYSGSKARLSEVEG